jgi:LacI family transcriptional regulator
MENNKITPKKNVTISDIARQADVSKSTVSRVINGTTNVNPKKKEAVLAAMKAMNFEPNVFAQGLASGSSKTIGVLTQNIGSPIYDAISQGVLNRLTQSPYSPIFADGQWKPDVGHAAVETLLGRKIDGLIVLGSVLPRSELDRVNSILPTIVVGREIEGWDKQSLFIDNEQAGYDATKHLIDLGHRRIAHITGIKNHQDSVRRMSGYKRALSTANIEFDEELIIEGHFDGNSGVMAIQNLLNNGKSFSAIFASNDMMAYGAKLALFRRGLRVPEDISLIGFDDQAESAFVTPPLTTVRQPARELGQAAADALLKLIAGADYELPILPTQIVVRESTKTRH